MIELELGWVQLSRCVIRQRTLNGTLLCQEPAVGWGGGAFPTLICNCTGKSLMDGGWSHRTTCRGPWDRIHPKKGVLPAKLDSATGPEGWCS